VAGENFFRQRHRARRRRRALELARAAGDRLGEREQPARLDDLPRQRILPARELAERDRLARLQAHEQVVIGHQHALVDVVLRVDGRERRRNRHADPRPLLRLHRGLARRAHALAVARDDHLEVAGDERSLREQPLAVDGDAGVRVLGDLFGLVVEAGPRRRHRVGVDVVEQILEPQILHPQVELAAQLPADELRILGQEEHALAARERDRIVRLHSTSLGSTLEPNN